MEPSFDWGKQREWGGSKPRCLSQGWKLWMFSRHCAKSCKLLDITVQPLKLKKETGLSSAPLKEKNVLLLKRNICPQSSALNWTWRMLVVFSIFLEIVRKEWNDFLNRFCLTWAASRRRLFVLHTACYGRVTWRPPVLQTEAAYSF